MTEVFDLPHAQRINKARMELLGSVIRQYGIKSCLDAGCGPGYFSKYMLDMGLRVTSVDARIWICQKVALPDFIWCDVEDLSLSDRYDLVLCFGLIYHLENPLRVARKLSKLSDKILVESLIVRSRKPVFVFKHENVDIDQGVNYMALIPSARALIEIFGTLGYNPTPLLVNHPEYRKPFNRRVAILFQRGDA